MNFKEYFEPIDDFLLEAPELLTRAANRVDPTLVDPSTGKSYRRRNVISQIKAIKEREINKGLGSEKLYGNLSCFDKFGIYYGAKDGGTPLGLYAYPLDYIINTGLANLPYGSGRKYLHIFKAKNSSIISMKNDDQEIADDLVKISDSIGDTITNFISQKSNFIRSWFAKRLRATKLDEDTADDLSYSLYDNTVHDILQKFRYLDNESFEENNGVSLTKYIDDKFASLTSSSLLEFEAGRIKISIDRISSFESQKIFDSGYTGKPSFLLFSKIEGSGKDMKFILSEDIKNFIDFISDLENFQIKKGDVVVLKTPIQGTWTHGFVKEIVGSKYLIKPYKKLYDGWMSDDNVDVAEFTKDQISLFSRDFIGPSIFRYNPQSYYGKIEKVSFVSVNPTVIETLKDKDFINLYDLQKLRNWELIMAPPISGYDFFHFIKTYISMSDPKIQKVIKFLSKKIIDFHRQIKRNKKELAGSISVPFGKELKDFCDENNISWSDVLLSTIRNLRSGDKVQISGMFVYKITQKISNELIKNENSIGKYNRRSWAVWSKLLRRLGISGIDDSEGLGAIHEAEPTQAVFFHPKYMQLISTLVVSKKSSRCEQELNVKKAESKKKSEIDWEEHDSPKTRWLKGIAQNILKMTDKLTNARYNYEPIYNKWLQNFGNTNIEEVKKQLSLNREFTFNIVNKFIISLTAFTRELSKEDTPPEIRRYAIKDLLGYAINNVKESLEIVQSVLEKINFEEERVLLEKVSAAVSLIKQLGAFDASDTKELQSIYQSSKRSITNTGDKHKAFLGKFERFKNDFNFRYKQASYYQTENYNLILVFANFFINAMKNFEIEDSKLKNTTYQGKPWRHDPKFDSLYEEIVEMKNRVIRSLGRLKLNTLPGFAEPERNKKLSDKADELINTIKKCVVPSSPTEEYTHFWCNSN